MRIQEIIQELETGIEDGQSPSTYENEFRFLGMDLFISEIEESYCSHVVPSEEEVGISVHFVIENFRILDCKVVRTDYGHEDERQGWIEDLICKL